MVPQVFRAIHTEAHAGDVFRHERRDAGSTTVWSDRTRFDSLERRPDPLRDFERLIRANGPESAEKVRLKRALTRAQKGPPIGTGGLTRPVEVGSQSLGGWGRRHETDPYEEKP